jgi:hypothetical protein
LSGTAYKYTGRGDIGQWSGDKNLNKRRNVKEK